LLNSFSKFSLKRKLFEFSITKTLACLSIEFKQFFKGKVYQTVIPRNVRLSEAPSHGVPILIYDKLCAGSKSYSSFTEEFLKQESIMESAA